MSGQILETYGYRPVLQIDSGATGDSELVLAKDGMPLGLQVSALYSTSPTKLALVFKTFAPQCA